MIIFKVFCLKKLYLDGFELIQILHHPTMFPRGGAN